jgi:hypothetical protein
MYRCLSLETVGGRARRAAVALFVVLEYSANAIGGFPSSVNGIVETRPDALSRLSGFDLVGFHLVTARLWIAVDDSVGSPRILYALGTYKVLCA